MMERSFVLGQATGSDRMGNQSSAEASETVYPLSGEGFTPLTDNVIVQVRTEDTSKTSPYVYLYVHLANLSDRSACPHIHPL